MSSNRSMLAAALRYAAQGLPVVPVESAGKAPLVNIGVHAASTDPTQIKDWWRRWPRAGLALACGEQAGFDVLDVDRQHGGIETLEAILDAHDRWPSTALQTTPSGGFHLLFRHEPGLKNWSGGQGTSPPGLDCRTTGTMIRTAPVPGYRWKHDLAVDQLGPWPACLAAFFRPIGHPARAGGMVAASLSPNLAQRACRYMEVALEGLASDIAAASPGCQQSTLNACSFRAGRLLAASPGRSAEEIEAWLVAAGMRMVNQRGRRPWQRHEIDKIVRRAIADGRRVGPADPPAKLLEPVPRRCRA